MHGGGPPPDRAGEAARVPGHLGRVSSPALVASGAPDAAPAGPDPRVAVVIVVLNGRRRIGRALERLTALPERPQVVVVDNASTDGTPRFVAEAFPEVRLVRLDRNLG